MDTKTELLREIYIFIAMKHRACNPWRIALDEWQEKVEKECGFNAFEEIEKDRKKNVDNSLGF